MTTERKRPTKKRRLIPHDPKDPRQLKLPLLQGAEIDLTDNHRNCLAEAVPEIPDRRHLEH